MSNSRDITEAEITEPELPGLPKRVRLEQTYHSGPLPPPEILVQYDQVISGGAERIMKMAEKSQDHLHIVHNAEIKFLNRGQVFGVIMALTALIIACILALKGHDTVAGVIGGTTVLGLVSVFVLGKITNPD